jgi:hypothetical protein
MAEYNPRRATPSVQAEVAEYISHLVQGGYDGSIYSAESACRKRLQQLGCSQTYIDAALTFAHTIADNDWKRKSKPNDQ